MVLCPGVVTCISYCEIFLLGYLVDVFCNNFYDFGIRLLVKMERTGLFPELEVAFVCQQKRKLGLRIAPDQLIVAW